ncbi:SDR family NAD(P)-dependent oxidoreductase [Tundrisphaera sp. TA3]|uniref:SDR family NAD(P)-dependent oxidoreductase n=1 Tax=Tundrisphaera sp. TA3 TaxID=3435775 RepID=UPI003EBC0FE3
MTTPPTVLITGAARGIGKGAALALAAKGCRLALLDRIEGPLAETAAQLRETGATVAEIAVDVTDGPAVKAAVVDLERLVGPIDALLACAGIGGLSPLPPDLDVAGLRAMLDVNVVGVANAMEAVLPGMIERKRGHIVGVSSVAGYRGLPWMVAYSASKAALSAYLEGLRPALRRRGVTITTACPGFVRTAITQDTPFRKPVAMMEPEQAGRHLARAVFKRPRNCVFPMSTAVGMAFLKHVPDRWFDWMMDRAGPRALTTDF